MALLKEDSAFTHVVAIDFGTGCSGYAIAPRHLDQDGKARIEVFNPCDGSDDQKTPTAILFSNAGHFVEFGSNALQQYAQIVEDGGTALLFQNYKMQLLQMSSVAKAVDGRELPLMLVIQNTLKYIADRAMHKLKEQVGTVLPAKIRWVLTVPALWSEEHKLFMRKAAHLANIIPSPSSTNLLLCLEPEGASIQCRQDSEPALNQQLTKGKVVMVLDCGGGTVDITVHKLLCQVGEEFLCSELIPSSGGCEWGSKYVDIYFEEFLKEVLCDANNKENRHQQQYGLYQKEEKNYYNNNALGRLDVLRDFQVVKRKFKGEEKTIVKLSSLGEEINSKRLKQVVQKYNQRHGINEQIKCKGSSNIQIPSSVMKSFFMTLFENIKIKVQQLIEQIHSKNQSLDFVFMVGGFSQSPYLKSEILSRFSTPTLQIIVPRRPQISVVRGACLYGLNPRSIQSRIAKKTYGINTLTVYDPQVHPASKRVLIEGEQFCEDVFDAFVRKGESVGVDEVHTKVYCPVRTKQTVMRILFYQTDSSEVEFVDGNDVRMLGELAVDIGKGEKTVKVTLLFGSTHIYATATNHEGTQIKNCEFKFQCNK